jgi:hypothetical protein
MPVNYPDNMSLNEIERKIRSDFNEQFNKKDKKDESGEVSVGGGPWIEDVYLRSYFIVANSDGKLYKVPFGMKDGSFVFSGREKWEEGTKKFIPDKSPEDEGKEKDEKENPGEKEKDKYAFVEDM